MAADTQSADPPDHISVFVYLKFPLDYTVYVCHCEAQPTLKWELRICFYISLFQTSPKDEPKVPGKQWF